MPPTLFENVATAGCARGCGSDRPRCPAAPASPRPRPTTASRSASASSSDSLRRRGERPQHGQRQAGAAPGRVDRQIDRVAEPAIRSGVLAPLGQPVAPPLGRGRGKLVGRHCRARRLALVDPRPKIFRPQARETSAAGCPGLPWGRSRSPGCRRSPPLPGAPGTDPSCRCRSCRRTRRASSGPWSRRARAFVACGCCARSYSRPR